LIAHPENVATPAVAERGFAVHDNTAPDVPVAGVIVSVTALVSEVTVLPLKSCTATTGWVVNATPAAAPVGDVRNASLTGTALTVNPFVSVAVPASGLVTVTSRAPAAAFDATPTFTVSWVEELNVVEFTVIPEPENDTVAPDTNPVPVTVTFWFAAPCGRLFGLSEVTVGPLLTVNALFWVFTPPSGLVTVRFRFPVVAFDAIDTLTVNEVDDTNVVEFTVMPVPENDTVAPETNPVPVIVKFWLAAP
jgi:hypothetical protein